MLKPLKNLGTPGFVTERFAKSMSHEIRVKIIVMASARLTSATTFLRKYPQYTRNQVWNHFRRLEELEAIERVKVLTGGKRRGGREVFFRANFRALLGQTSWAILPEEIRGTVTGATAATLFERIHDAMQAGVIDIRPDRHFTWTGAQYDQQAWKETISELEDVFDRLPDRQVDASVRMAASGEEPIHATVMLGCFESLADDD